MFLASLQTHLHTIIAIVVGLALAYAGMEAYERIARMWKWARVCEPGWRRAQRYAACVLGTIVVGGGLVVFTALHAWYLYTGHLVA